MATWTIPSSEMKSGATRPAASKIQSPSQARMQATFASVMASQQAEANQASSQDGPRVARISTPAGMPLRNPVLAGRTPSDMVRMQTFNKAQVDLQKTRGLEGLLQSAGSSTLDVARNMGAATQLRTIAAAGNGNGFALTNSDFIHTRKSAASNGAGRRRTSAVAAKQGLGKLSARFESGGDGIAAIGYDRNGGTSYGKYQIASRVGSMKNFLSFLDTEAPDIASRLRKAGPANTGSRSGAMPKEWRAIAQEQPERFEQLQEAFIHQSHYRPALEAIEQKLGLDSSQLSAAMREVIWSTAVQHGPAGAARIFAQADNMSGKTADPGYERKLINNVYSLRADQFGSSTAQVRDAVRNRFREERQLALNMLDNQARGNLG